MYWYKNHSKRTFDIRIWVNNKEITRFMYNDGWIEGQILNGTHQLLFFYIIDITTTACIIIKRAFSSFRALKILLKVVLLPTYSRAFSLQWQLTVNVNKKRDSLRGKKRQKLFPILKLIWDFLGHALNQLVFQNTLLN